MAGNMESLLLGGDDDSSSGESDAEDGVKTGTGVVTSTVAAPAPAAVAPASAPPPPAAPAATQLTQQTSQQPASAPTTTAMTSSTSGSMSQSEMALRLKSMYSPASKKPSGPPTVPAPAPAPASQQQQPTVQSTSAVHQVQQQPQPRAVPPIPSSTQRRHVAHPSQQAGVRQPAVAQPQQQTAVPPPQATLSSSSQTPSNLPPPNSRMMPSRVRSNDPFEPTPVAAIVERHQKKVQGSTGVAIGGSVNNPVVVPSGGMTYGSGTTTTPAAAGSASTGAPSTATDRTFNERDMKKQKEKFLIFTRVLMKYLENKDPALHTKVKAIIKECAERNKRQEPGYESVTASMKQRLKEVVNDGYWKRAEAYLENFLVQKEKEKMGGAAGGANKPKPATDPTSKAELEKIRKAQQAKQQQLHSSSQHHHHSSTTMKTPTNQPSLNMLRQEIQGSKRPSLDNSASSTTNKYSPIAVGSSNKPTTGTTASFPAPTPSSTVPPSKGKGTTSQPKRGSKTPATTAATTNVVALGRKSSSSAATPGSESRQQQQEPQPVREYSEFMEMVDHAIDYDWTTAGMMLGHKAHLQLADEQRALLYSDLPGNRPAPATATPDYSFALPGWGRRNVVSCRAAWARLRLRERRRATSGSNGAATLGSGTLLQPSASTTEESIHPTAIWSNDEKAEEDQALAALSEGAQLYLKSVLEKALHCARQRQNLDGIRLWHQQAHHAAAAAAIALKGGSASSASKAQPSLLLRLGCDVERQVAQSAGNAAMTCKRMEEALERQSGVPYHDRLVKNETVVVGAQSMSELALLPKLTRGVEDADYHAKRCYETYGGKESQEPPLGRVPKRAKLEVVDLQMGMHFVNPTNKKNRAQTVLAGLSF